MKPNTKTILPPDTEKIQPWKAFPPNVQSNQGYQYPEAKKGEVMILGSGSARCMDYNPEVDKS
jgi:hypothetical protein